MRHGLLRHIAIPFALFVVVGSLALVGWLRERERADSRDNFRLLAQTNANFIRRSNLPSSSQLADSLSEILKVTVVFHEGSQLRTPTAPSIPFFITESKLLRKYGKVLPIGDGREAIRVPLHPDTGMIFVRRTPGFFADLARQSTLLPLAIFWLLSLLLAKAISKNLVRPIHALASSVSDLNFTDASRAFPGSDRRDEIGDLARSLTDTRANLHNERHRREKSEKLALLSKMATGLAHEIRNPVSAVRIHAQLLKAEGICSDTASLIEGEALKIESLVTQWMFLARPEPPDLNRQDLRSVIRKCLEALRPACDHAMVQPVVELPVPLICYVDEPRVSQALRNLMINGIQAMPDGGELCVKGEVSGDDVVVSVSDQGSGFSEETLKRFGEMFYSTKEGGMGVGLSVASEIVKAHRGQLVPSHRDKGGACVLLSLPTTEASPTTRHVT